MRQLGQIMSILLITAIVLALAPPGSASEICPNNSGFERASFRLISALGTRTLEERPEILDQKQIKSPNRAFVSSLLVPGSGQLYLGAKRGYLHITAEAGLLAAYFITRNSAEDRREDYREHVRTNVRFDGPCTFETWDPVEDYEHATLYDNWHNVYTERKGKPLERTGKWYWADRAAFKGEDREGKDDSSERVIAFELRKKANDKFELARTFLGGIMLNHVVSAIEARIAAKGHNRKHVTQETSAKPLELDLKTTVSPHAFQSQLVLRKRF